MGRYSLEPLVCNRTRLSVGFAVLAVLLLVAFAASNGMAFESSESGG